MNNQHDDLEESPFTVEPAEPVTTARQPQPQFSKVDIPKKRRTALPLILLFAAIAIGALLFHFNGRFQSKPRLVPGANPTLTMKVGTDAPDLAASEPLAPLNVAPAKATGIDDVLLKASEAAANSSNALSGQADLHRKLDELTIVVGELAAAQKARDEREAVEKQAAQAALAERSRLRASRASTQRSAQVRSTSAKEPTAKLLAVDVWGGLPSAALGNTGDGRVKFLQPSETVGGVSMLAANPDAQSATMKVGDRTIQLERDR